MMHDWYWGGGGFGWVGLLFMLLFWVVIIVGVVFLVRGLWGQNQGRDRDYRGAPERQEPRRSTALEVLEERYARGEINREEFLERRKDLLG